MPGGLLIFIFKSNVCRYSPKDGDVGGKGVTCETWRHSGFLASEVSQQGPQECSPSLGPALCLSLRGCASRRALGCCRAGAAAPCHLLLLPSEALQSPCSRYLALLCAVSVKLRGSQNPQAGPAMCWALVFLCTWLLAAGLTNVCCLDNLYDLPRHCKHDKRTMVCVCHFFLGSPHLAACPCCCQMTVSAAALLRGQGKGWGALCRVHRAAPSGVGVFRGFR